VHDHYCKERLLVSCERFSPTIKSQWFELWMPTNFECATSLSIRFVHGHILVPRSVTYLLFMQFKFGWPWRSFSGLWRLKTYLRSTMGQQRLNSTIIAAAHTEQLDNIDLLSVAQEFACLNDARRNMYGAF